MLPTGPVVNDIHQQWNTEEATPRQQCVQSTMKCKNNQSRKVTSFLHHAEFNAIKKISNDRSQSATSDWHHNLGYLNYSFIAFSRYDPSLH